MMTYGEKAYWEHRPVGYSYRVSESIYAGEYPVWDWDTATRQRQIRMFTDFGITDFLDLTEYGEMPPYEEFLPDGVRRHTFPIRNGGIPESHQAVAEMFGRLEDLFTGKDRSCLYIHCHGGVGRTGTIVSCCYIYFRHLSQEEAVARMRSQFSVNPRSRWMNSPENQSQMDFIKGFRLMSTGDPVM